MQMTRYSNSRVNDRANNEAVARLDIRAPLLAGCIAVVAFFAAGAGGAAYAPIENGVGFAGKIIHTGSTEIVRHARGGRVSDVNVSEGQHVAVGDVLMTLDSQMLAEEIGALKSQSEAATRQIELIRAEAATLDDLLARKLVTKARVLQIESQLSEVSKEAASLAARIIAAQGEIEKSALRAPVSGRVTALAVAGRGSKLAAGGAALEIVPDTTRLVVEGRLTPDQAALVKVGLPAKVWLTSSKWLDQKPFAAKLAWVAADSVSDKRTGAPYVSARIELDEARAAPGHSPTLTPGARAEILLVTGQSTLLAHVLEPVIRGMNRIFRG